MPLWKNTDAAANSPISAPMQFGLEANTDNQTAIFGNTTTNAFVTGLKIGVYGVSQGEQRAARQSASLERPAHAGFHLRTELADGRVKTEVLVAMGSLTGDAENTKFPEYMLYITTQPSNASKSNSNNEVATFTVVGNSTPIGATITYFWQKWGGSAFANLTAAGAYSNVTTATLSVLANTASNGEIYRVGVASANGGTATIYSSNAVLTVTT